MKKILLSIGTVCTLLLSFPFISSAQNFCKTDPSFTKVLNDTTYATAIEVTYMPGKTTNVHTHPAFFVYVLEGGTLKVTAQNGKVDMMELKTGDSMFGMPEGPHSTLNPGSKPVKLLLVEMKDHPFMVSSKMK